MTTQHTTPPTTSSPTGDTEASFTDNTSFTCPYKPRQKIDVVYVSAEGTKPFQHNGIMAMFCDFSETAENVIDKSRVSVYC